MTYIKTGETSFTTQASVSIDNCFSATYSHYLVVRNLLGSVGNENLSVRLRVSATDDSGGNYRRQYIGASSTTLDAVRSTGATAWTPGLGATETAAFGFASLRISNPFAAVRTTGWTDQSFDADGSITIQRTVFAHDLETSYDGFTVIPASGTITGTISVYGLKAS